MIEMENVCDPVSWKRDLLSCVSQNRRETLMWRKICKYKLSVSVSRQRAVIISVRLLWIAIVCKWCHLLMRLGRALRPSPPAPSLRVVSQLSPGWRGGGWRRCFLHLMQQQRFRSGGSRALRPGQVWHSEAPLMMNPELGCRHLSSSSVNSAPPA